MSNSEIDKAIAEFCGWKLVDVPGYLFNGIQVQMWQDPTGKRGVAHPCYSNDLNAICEVIESLPMEQYEAVWETLCDMIPYHIDEFKGGLVYNAKANLRAEAFLRTVGKWRDA